MKDVGQLTSKGASVELAEGEAVVVCRCGLLVGARMHERPRNENGVRPLKTNNFAKSLIRQPE